MRDISENEILILPQYDENGRAFYILPNVRTEENLVVACPKVAESVIPVIFLPGVMGSNLKDHSGGRMWHADLYQGIDALTLLGRTPPERKKLFDPATTEVDVGGKVLYNDLEGNIFPSREARGWGCAFYKSYGESLHTLQCMLNDSHILLDNLVNGTRRRTPRQLLIGENLGAEKNEEPLTEYEVRQSYDFLFPLHVFGYNWLQSNADSAQHLDRYISNVLSTYQGRLAVNKVILVTHSMGGLVARHYSENMNGRENILGIVHGVMPNLGSPAAYRRMKTGERNVVGAVIGADAANLMPVLAQAPGPLQLLPGKAHGAGWLRIHSSTGTINKPESDPYTEIYLNDRDWWRVCEKELLLDDASIEWENYKDRIKESVKKFIEGLNGKYHPNSWSFYGASNKYPSDEYLIWRKISRSPDYSMVTGLPYQISATHRKTADHEFRLVSSASPGDGTVPAKSGCIVSQKIRSQLATHIDHEGAYSVGHLDRGHELSVAMKFTLRAIIKIAMEVKSCG